MDNMKRRRFLFDLGKHVLAFTSLMLFPWKIIYAQKQHSRETTNKSSNLLIKNMQNSTMNETKPITLFLCGDVMTGRGIDQILPYPSDPRIYEPYMRNAAHYVNLAEQVNGPIPRPVDFEYIWGDTLEILDQIKPDVRIINLETSVTTSNDYWQGKGINYRMHPKNIPCLTVANIDCCVLANNHVLDWGYQGLADTLNVLDDAKIKIAGAGFNINQAESPAIMKANGKGRIIVFSFAHESSGVYPSWTATTTGPGVNLLKDLSDRTVEHIAQLIQSTKQANDIVVASIHWGANWGYHIPQKQQRFAHKLIDMAGADIIHGHSSHHVKGIEIYKEKPIIYGCGDFLSDYEGITGNEQYRDDLGLMYFISMDPKTGKLMQINLVPTQIRRFKLNKASQADRQWLADVLNREGKHFNSEVTLNKGNTLTLHW